MLKRLSFLVVSVGLLALTLAGCAPANPAVNPNNNWAPTAARTLLPAAPPNVTVSPGRLLPAATAKVGLLPNSPVSPRLTVAPRLVSTPARRAVLPTATVHAAVLPHGAVTSRPMTTAR